MFYCRHVKQNLKVQQLFIFSRTTEENSFIALGKLNEPPTLRMFTNTKDQE